MNTVSDSTVSNTELSEFFAPRRVPGRELSQFLSASYLCAKANSLSSSQNSPSLLQNSVRLSEFSSPKQYSRNSIPPRFLLAICQDFDFIFPVEPPRCCHPICAPLFRITEASTTTPSTTTSVACHYCFYHYYLLPLLLLPPLLPLPTTTTTNKQQQLLLLLLLLLPPLLLLLLVLLLPPQPTPTSSDTP